MGSRRGRQGKQAQQLVGVVVAIIALLMVIGTVRIVFQAPQGAPAQTYDSYNNPEGDRPLVAQEPQQVSVLSIYGKAALLVCGGLAVIMALKWLSGSSPPERRPASGDEPPGAHMLTVRDAITLGRSRELHLVEVGNHILIVGSVADRMSLLAEWSCCPPEASDTAPGAAEVAVPAPLARGMDREPLAHRPPQVARQEHEWAERRAQLIDALKEQVEA